MPAVSSRTAGHPRRSCMPLQDVMHVFTAQLLVSAVSLPSKSSSATWSPLAITLVVLLLLPSSDFQGQLLLAPQPRIASLRPIRPQLLTVFRRLFLPLIIILLISDFLRNTWQPSRRRFILARATIPLASSHLFTSLPASPLPELQPLYGLLHPSFTGLRSPSERFRSLVASAQVFFPALPRVLSASLEAVRDSLSCSVVLEHVSANRSSFVHQCVPVKYDTTFRPFS